MECCCDSPGYDDLCACVCVGVCVCLHPFGFIGSMSRIVFIHLMNLNKMFPLLTIPTWFTIIHYNREREREWESDQGKAWSERERERKAGRRSQREPAWLAPGWLRGGVCVKSVLRGEWERWSSPCLIRRTLVCPRLIVSWAPQGGGPPLNHYTSWHADSCRSNPRPQPHSSHRNREFGL